MVVDPSIRGVVQSTVEETTLVESVSPKMGLGYESPAFMVLRFLWIGWGLLTVFPSIMMSDDGTDLAHAAATTLLWSSLYFILAGIVGSWSLAAAALVTMFLPFVSLPEKIHLTLITFLVPTVLVLGSLSAVLEWRGWLPSRLT